MPKRHEEALAWFRKAAKSGHSSAQVVLGLMYHRGVGVPEDVVKAAKWRKRAAEQGDSEGQLVFGAMHYLGQGMPEDHVSAYAWVSLAAAQGNERAKEGMKLLLSDFTPELVLEGERLARDLAARIARHARV